jgi:putative membrane protein
MSSISLHPSLVLLAASWDRIVLLGFEVHVSVLVGCLYLAVVYLLLVGPARRRYGWSEPDASPARKGAWLAGVALIFLSLNGPLHEWADEYSFAAHMVQHMVLMLFVPPLLVAGLPPWLIRRALRRRWVYRLGRALTHPMVAYTAYNVVFIGWHFPEVYNAALVDHDLHILQHLMFISVATMMWWPVVNPVEELERIPTGPLLMMYVFAFGVPSTAVSAFITLSEELLYPWYGATPGVWGLDALGDQRLGGLIMWIPGMLIFWVAISFVFFRWTKDEFAEWRREAEERRAAEEEAGRPS